MTTPTQALSLARDALAEVIRACKKAKVDLTAGIRDGEPVHPVSASLTFPLATAINALAALDALAQQASVSSAEPAELWRKCPECTANTLLRHRTEYCTRCAWCFELPKAAPLMANGPETAAKWCAVHQHYKPCEHTQETAATASVAGLVHNIPSEWRHALRQLAFMARTSGGTAGPDRGLMEALDRAERLLSEPYLPGATPPAASAPTVQPLPARLVRFTLRDLKAERKRLDGFISLGNEIERAAEYDEWIAALEAYCAAHGITAAPTKETP